MENIIKIKKINFSYNLGDGSEEKKVLQGISMEVKKGSFISVIGKNGSGKSTLAKTINALILPQEGEVWVAGFNTKDYEYIWDIRQSAGMVFQNPDNQLVSSIVEDDVAFGPENLGIEPKEIRRRVDDALLAVEMGDFKNKSPYMLSGGQKQRIAIAGVVAMKPSCIIFDEPTAMLDPKGRREVMEIIKKLNREGITTILITHFMEEVAQAQEVIVMDEGRIVMNGTPREIFMRREELEALNLTVPFEQQLAEELRKGGIEVPQDILNKEEMVEFLCQYK